MKHFTELPMTQVNGGIQFIFKASNGYGASIVRHDFSYGGRNGLWEVAILDKDGNIDYTTSITDDVLGYLTETDVMDTLKKIEELS